MGTAKVVVYHHSTNTPPLTPCVHPTTNATHQAADRYNINRSWEHIQNKHVGTGHPDFTKQ